MVLEIWGCGWGTRALHTLLTRYTELTSLSLLQHETSLKTLTSPTAEIITAPIPLKPFDSSLLPLPADDLSVNGIVDRKAASAPLPPTYPPVTPSLVASPIAIRSVPGHGRGLFAAQEIEAGTVVEISPVLLVGTGAEYERRDGVQADGRQLKDCMMEWGGKEGGMALALGLGSLFSHSTTPNVQFQMDHSTYTIYYKTSRQVAEGEELTIAVDVRKTESEGTTVVAEVDEAEADAIKEKERLKTEWENEIVPFDELGWSKVTSLVEPEDQLLTTIECWAIDIPARHAQLAFNFVRKNAIDLDFLSHIKKIRRPRSAPPGSPSNVVSTTANTVCSVMLFPTSSAPDNLSELLADSPLAFLSPIPFKVQVPASVARTEEQCREWSKLWPVNMVLLRVGPNAKIRHAGWARAKHEWVTKEGEKVWMAALEAQKRGEYPIACHVTESFDPAVHSLSSSSLPKTLVRAHDTRLSTSNILSHAAANAIDYIAVMDCHGLRDLPHLPHLPLPYLLTGLSVFMSHEPCLLCAMSLLHSRIGQLYYIKRAPGSGGCGSVYGVHEDGGLNHRFEVWQWKRDEEVMKEYKVRGEVGEGLEVQLDP